MRSSIKLIVTAAVLIIAGACVCGAAVLAMGFTPGDLNTSNIITNEYEIEDTFKDIIIKGDSESIVLAKATDGKCSVSLKEYENEPHTVTVEDNKLIVERKASDDWNLNISIGTSTGITLYLPEDLYGNIDIDTDSGKLEISGISAEDLSFNGDSGWVNIRDCKIIDTIQVTVDSGKVGLENINCTDLDLSGDSGFLDMKNVVAARNMDIKRESGMVTLDDCDAAMIRVETESGAVKGTLLSGKTFKVSSESGSVKVPQDGGNGVCEIKTESGLVLISIK